MSKATLTKRIEFCASHRYHNPHWDAATNQKVFGPCNNERSHGHNYLLEVTLRGEIDPVTGMIINLYDLKQILTEVLEAFDHKYLNLDTPYFHEKIPTTENIAMTLWGILDQHPQLPELDLIRLHEDRRLFADIRPESFSGSPPGLPQAWITRRYGFSAASHSAPTQLTGHNYSVDVKIGGPIHPDTGQVVNLHFLDEVVQDRVLDRFHAKNLTLDPAFKETPVTETTVAEFIWESIAQTIDPGRLTEVTVSEQVDSLSTFEASQS